MTRVICPICPHSCSLSVGQVGFCKGRANLDGKVVPINYGLVTSLALDPIEKKPLYKFHPGSTILSIGSFGCNLRCPFCQNYEISMAGKEHSQVRRFTPGEIVELALSLKNMGNIGIAYTYNEPLIGYEFVYDCASLAKKRGLKNILVTNGYCSPDKFLRLLPVIDALNIDLKAFTKEFYQKISGDLDTVKTTIKLAAQTCHVEVTNLIVPGENDSEFEMEGLSTWLASIDASIPLHISRFFPRYQVIGQEATNVKLLHRLAKIARDQLEFVYLGNC